VVNSDGSDRLRAEPHSFQIPVPTQDEWTDFKSHLARLSIPDRDPGIPFSLLQAFRRLEWPRLIAAASPTDWRKSVESADGPEAPTGRTTPSAALQNHLVLKRLLGHLSGSDLPGPGTVHHESILNWMLASAIGANRPELQLPLTEAGSAIQSLLEHSASRVAQSLQELCEIAVTQLGPALAWCSLLAEPTRSLEIAGWAGPASNYLDEIQVRIDPDRPEGHGPMALSFRTGQIQVIQVAREDPLFKPWKENAARHGLASSVAIPIRIQGLTIGVFAVYAREPGFFTEPVIHPYEELVLAVSNRLETLTQQLSLQRLLRAYRAGHAINEIAARHVPLHELCENVCRILTEFLGLGLCYIVETPSLSKGPHILTAAGRAKGFLKDLDFSLDPTHPDYGLSGLVYTAGKPVIVNRLEEESRLAYWHERLRIHALKAAAGFPLYRSREGRQPWGTLILFAFKTGCFDASLVSHLAGIASGLNLAIEEDFQRQKLFRVERFYSALGEFGHYLATDPPLSPLLQKTCELTSNAGEIAVVYITLLDPLTHAVRIEAFSGPASDRIRNVPVMVDPARPEGRGVTGTIFHTCRPVIVNNLNEKSTIWLSDAERDSVASIAGFPLLINGECHGVLGVGALVPDFFDDELNGLLERVADMVGTALNHSYEKIQLDHFENLFRALSELHRLVARHPDPRLLYQEVGRILGRVNGAAGNAIVPAPDPAGTGQTDPTVAALVPTRFFSGVSGDFPCDFLRPFCRQLVTEATSGRTPILVRRSHSPGLPPRFEGIFQEAGIREIGVFPILFRGQAFAALVLLSNEDGFFKSDALIELCKQFTDAITLALVEHERENELKQMALMDSLTGLPNRNLFFDRLDGALRQSERNRSLVGIAILDIDHFKEVNDRFGHEAGDLLLATQAHRMETLLNDQSTVARLAGDEFGLILAGLETEVAMTGILEHLRSELAGPVTYQEQSLHTTVSLGLTIYPQDHQPPQTLLRHADLALYRAKSRGRNAWALFKEDFEKRLEQQMEIRNRFQQALARGDLRLDLQPVIDLRDGHLVSAEACARWPGFSPTSEDQTEWLNLIETDPDLVPQTGRYLLDAVGLELEILERAGFTIPVSLNTNLRYLLSPSFESDLRNWYTRHGAHADRLVLELKPSPLLPDWDRLPSLTENLNRKGIRITFDNFGAWPVALGKIDWIHAQGIKVDRSLILRLREDPRALSLVAGAVRSGEIGHFEVTAVDIEREDLAVLFHALGGYQAQGSLISPPLHNQAFIEWSRRWTLPAGLARSLARASDARLLPLRLNGVYHRWLRGQVDEALQASPEIRRSLLPALSCSSCSLTPWPGGLRSARQRKLRLCHEELHTRLHRLAAAARDDRPARSLEKQVLAHMREYEEALDALLEAAPPSETRGRGPFNPPSQKPAALP
jgi:diguanylate cyclase (GGDEF)-like protein